MRGEVVKALAVPDIRERMVNEGAKPVGDTPAEFGKFLREEITRWTKIIREKNIKAEE